MNRVLAAVPLVALAVLAGCGGDEPDSGLPEFGGTPAASAGATEPSASASSSAPPTDAAFTDAVKVTPGRISAEGDGRAAADAWVGYWTVRTEAYHAADAGSPELARLSSGAALDEVRSYAAQLRERGHHTVGELTVGVRKVTVEGATAKVTSCLENRTIDVDENLRPAETPTPRYLMSGTLTRAAEGWKVTKITVERRGSC